MANQLISNFIHGPVLATIALIFWVLFGRRILRAVFRLFGYTDKPLFWAEDEITQKWTSFIIRDGARTSDEKCVVRFMKGMCNGGTHGLRNYLNHPELQLVLALESDTAVQEVFENIIERLEAGERFTSGQKVEGVFRTPVRLDLVTDKDRGEEVFRIVFPDQNGLWPEDEGCASVVRQQKLPTHEMFQFVRKN